MEKICDRIEIFVGHPPGRTGLFFSCEYKKDSIYYIPAIWCFVITQSINGLCPNSECSKKSSLTLNQKYLQGKFIF